MRDQRFVAVHRGGPLEVTRHRLLAAWAADCAEHVLPLFESSGSGDDRPRRAIEVARAWSRGEVAAGVAMKAAVAAHAAARAATSRAATEAARAAGHAAATAHMAEHSLGAVVYGLKAVAAAGGDGDAERAWQRRQIPPTLQELVTAALAGGRFRKWA